MRSLAKVVAAAGVLVAGERVEAQPSSGNQAGHQVLPVREPAHESADYNTLSPLQLRILYGVAGAAAGLSIGAALATRAFRKHGQKSLVNKLHDRIDQVFDEVSEFEKKMTTQHDQATGDLKKIEKFISENALSDDKLAAFMKEWSDFAANLQEKLTDTEAYLDGQLQLAWKILEKANPFWVYTERNVMQPLDLVRAHMLPGTPPALYEHPSLCEEFNAILRDCLACQNRVVGYLLAKGHDGIINALAAKCQEVEE